MLGKHLLMASIAVVSSALFVRLVVLGWGGFGAFLAHPHFIAILVVFVLLMGAALFTQANLNPASARTAAIADHLGDHGPQSRPYLCAGLYRP
jgi:hypothetical protein